MENAKSEKCAHPIFSCVTMHGWLAAPAAAGGKDLGTHAGHFEGLSKHHNSFLISCLGLDRGVIASAKNTKQLIVAANLNRFIL